MQDQTLAFIGAGNMTRALVGGLCAAGKDPASITVTGKHPQRREQLAADYGVRVAPGNRAALRDADLVILSVKPQNLIEVLQELRPALAPRRPLVLSVAAGVRTATLSRELGDYPRVARSMPNRPSLLGCGIAALYAPASIDAAERSQLEGLMRAVGETVWVEREELMDPVTAVSGAGPAYFFLLMELMEAAARELGLDAQTARKLCIETAYGAACMARDGAQAYPDPAQLRAEVASRGGATEAALGVFETAGLRETVARALAAATQRARELAAQAAAPR